MCAQLTRNRSFPGPISRLICIWIGLSLLSAQADGQSICTPLAPPTGPTVEVGPEDSGQLKQIVNTAPNGASILLRDGYYDMSLGDATSRLTFSKPDVTLRSLNGNRDAVVLDGGYITRELISILASNVVIADLTVYRALDHPIHISGLPGDPIVGTTLHNLAVIDPGQQAIKINPNDDGYADFGTIECSLISLSATGRQNVRDNCYTGGIDAHKAWGWTIRKNWIEGFWCTSGLSEHGIHFWNASRDTLIEDNVILDCARGIGLGMRESGPDRIYPDNPYPGVGYLGHIDGVVRNNFIAAADPGLLTSSAGFDSGITMEQARGTGVYHNSVASTASPESSSIEWRFENTLVDIANNLATSILKARNGGQALLAGNIENAPTNSFQQIEVGDLHLSPGASNIIDAGEVLPAGLANRDFDAQSRNVPPDVGADEVIPGQIFADGFESGATSEWIIKF